MKWKIDINSIKQIGRDKLILIGISLAVIIICLIWENSGDGSNEAKDSGSTENLSASKQYSVESYISDMEKRLENIIGEIDGVGRVHVMITVKTGSSQNILTEKDVSYEDTDEEDGEGGKRVIYSYSEDNQTVYVTDEKGRTYPYVISENSPLVEGVAVITKGNTGAVQKQKIINVIKSLFPLEVNKISVE